ncbi:MAG: hypothetical protein ACM34H_07465, partial [Deltaproteobacteria bacterium]
FQTPLFTQRHSITRRRIVNGVTLHASPTSASFRTPTICCSVDRDRFIQASWQFHPARKLYFQSVYETTELTPRPHPIRPKYLQ